MGILLSTSFQSFVQLLGVLLIFIFVLVITYITTKWLAGYQKSIGKNKNLQVIETVNVGNNKFVSLIAVGKRYITVAVGKEEIHMLTEVDESDLVDLSFKEEKIMKPSESFQDVLDKFKNKLPKK